MRVKVKAATGGFEKHIGEVFESKPLFYDKVNGLYWKADEVEVIGGLNTRGFDEEELQKIIDQAFGNKVVRGGKFKNIKTDGIYTVSDKGLDLSTDRACVVYKNDAGATFIRDLEEFKEKFVWVAE